VQNSDEEIRICLRKYQRWPKFENVMMRTVSAREYSAVAQPINDIVSLFGGRFTRVTVKYQVDAEE
jgi:hypothetical protein